MSDILRKEFASAIKWIAVIIVAAMAYNNFAPNYYFMRQGPNLYRGNKVTGNLEYLEYNEWVNFTESLFSQELRLERKKGEEIRVQKMKKEPLAFLEEFEDLETSEDTLDDASTSYEYRGRT